MTTKLKNKVRFENSGVYRVPCECYKVYVGETVRKISTRLNRSAMAEHALETGYTIRFDEAKIPLLEDKNKRKLVEIGKHSNNLNRDEDQKLNYVWRLALE